MSLYTFILEYHGGTYISQFEAPTPADALESWINEHDHSVIAHFEPEYIEAIWRDYDSHSFVPISGVANVWCFTFEAEGHLGLLNFVLTTSS